MRRVAMICAGLTAALLLAAPAWADLPGKLAGLYLASKPLPLPSSKVKGLTIDQAYQFQAKYVAALLKAGHKVAGYKAGLTSKPAQKRFKAPGPVTGVLFTAGLLPKNKVDLGPFTRCMLEVELGYVMKKDVTAPTSNRKVKRLVDRVLPVIEVPDLNFASFKGLTFQDIIATNVGSRAYILGKPVAVKGFKVSKVSGQLFYNGKPLGKPVPSRAAMGGQWKALAWSINNILAHGGKVKKGMLIITGSLGRMYPGKPGSYKAVYTGGLGEIRFSIK